MIDEFFESPGFHTTHHLEKGKPFDVVGCVG
jgi:hypothetical protein